MSTPTPTSLATVAVVEGVDFCTLSPEGRLVSVVGFIDKMPTG